MSRLPLPLVVFLSAAAALAIELAIVRLGAPHVGQSLLPWTAAITAVLLGLTLGHALGGRAGGPEAAPARLRELMAASCLCAGMGAVAMPALVEPVATLFADGPGSGARATLALMGLCFLPSVAAGFVTPLAIRIAMATARDGAKPALPRRIAAIYAASAIGSVAGTAAAGFWLLEQVGASGLALGAAALWGATGVLLLRWRGRPAHAAGWTALALLTTAGAMALGIASPCSVESRYTCVRYLDGTGSAGERLRFMILDEGVHSATDLDDPGRLPLGYAALVDRLAGIAFAASPERSALVIGGGGATLPRAWARAQPPTQVLVAELDPVVAAEAARAMDATGPHLRTVTGDGRAVLRAEPPAPRYDVVLMDAYRTHTVPPHLVTAEFGALVHARLRENGVFLSNVIDRAGSLLLARSLALTLAPLYGRVEIWVAQGEAADGATNAVVAAWKRAADAPADDVLTVTASVMPADDVARRRTVSWRRLEDEATLRRRLGGCARRLSDDRAPVDRLLAGQAPCPD